MAGRRRRDCRFLLGILTLLLLLFPFFEEMARPILIVAIIASVFVLGVIVVEANRFHVRNAIALALVQIVLTGLTFIQTVDSPGYILTAGLGLATTTLLIGYSIYCVVSYVLQAKHITHDQIYAGICAYLMLGFAFGCIYYLVETLAPGCFAVNTGKLAGDPPDLMYFSFVTLATLGYGDITPIAKISRALAEVEALAGMLYIAIFMARLVSMAGGRPPVPTVADHSHNATVTTTGPEPSACVERARATHFQDPV